MKTVGTSCKLRQLSNEDYKDAYHFRRDELLVSFAVGAMM